MEKQKKKHTHTGSLVYSYYSTTYIIYVAYDRIF